MNPTVSSAQRSVPVGSLDTLRPTPAKAGLNRTAQSEALGSSDQIGLALGNVIKDAVVKHYGSVKAAAISLRVDPSLMVRELEAGKIARLEHADDEAKAAIAAALYAVFWQIENPKARARRAVKDVLERIKELEAFIEYSS